MVCLGIRRLSYGAMLHNLGRETFLAPVTWTEHGWPKVGINGTIHETMEGPLPQAAVVRRPSDFNDDFIAPEFDSEWTFIRNPDFDKYKTGNGKLVIEGSCETLNDCAPSFIGIRQKEFKMSAKVTVSADFSNENAKAGITAYYSKENHYDFYLQKENGKLYAVLSRKIMDLEAVTGRIYLGEEQNEATLQIQTSESEYIFSVVGNNGAVTVVGSGCTAGLCTEGTRTMTFTGTFIGLFANDIIAEFRSFSLIAL